MNVKKFTTPTLALAGFVALSLLSSHAFAQDERGMPADLRAMVETERAFSRESEAKGMKEAFISFAADDGVLFRRTVVNAKELWRNANPAPTGLLTWRPSFADISRAGDMGYDFGPKPSEQGHYVRIWKRTHGGPWRVVLGVINPVRPPAQ